MEIYRLKSKTHKISFLDSDIIKKFCLDLGLIMFYEKTPRSHWSIKDIQELHKDKILNFLNAINLPKVKPTTRSNLVEAKSKMKGVLYHDSLKPSYQMKTSDEISNIMQSISSRYDVKLTTDMFI